MSIINYHVSSKWKMMNNFLYIINYLLIYSFYFLLWVSDKRTCAEQILKESVSLNKIYYWNSLFYNLFKKFSAVKKKFFLFKYHLESFTIRTRDTDRVLSPVFQSHVRVLLRPTSIGGHKSFCLLKRGFRISGVRKGGAQAPPPVIGNQVRGYYFANFPKISF